MSTTLSKIGIVITGDNSSAQDKIQGTLDSIKGFTAVTAGLAVARQVFDGISQSIKTLWNVAEQGLARFADTADRLGSMKDIAEQFDLSTAELTSFSRAARMAGSSQEALQDALAKLRHTIGAGKDDPFTAIGLSIEKLSQLTTSGQMGAIFDALNKITDPSKRQAAGEDIFGKMFKSIDLFSRGGSSGLAQAVKEAEKLGIVLDAGLVARVDKADDALKDVYQQFSSIGDTVVSSFAPGLERASKSISEMLAAMSSEGGAMDKIVSRMEATVHFAGLYLKEAGNIASVASAGINALPGAKGIGGGFLGGMFGGLPGFVTGSVNDLGAQTEKSNALDESIAKLKLDRLNKDKADAALEDARKKALQNNMGDMFGALRGVGKDLGGGGAWFLKQWNELDKFANNFSPAGNAIKTGNAQAGALDVGTAAAYAAAFSRMEPKEVEQKKGNKLISDGNKVLEKIQKAVEGWAFVPV